MRVFALALVLFLGSYPAAAYSVLTHEAIVDSAWEKRIQPLLKTRFPRASSDDLAKARAYVYGGSLVQDLGYAPFSSKTFSDLAHYVRSGDFVAALLQDAQTLDEYAFALGALAHYTSDRFGHPAVNRITGMIYPKLRRKYGEVVTYEDSPSRHLSTEFALDVIQVSRGLYASNAFHDFIGFEIAQSVLERAFQDTYGFPLKDLFASEDLAIGTYRYAAGSLIPQMTKVAWTMKSKDIQKLNPSIDRSSFVYSLPQSGYEKQWGTMYRKPGIFARLLGWIVRIMPKIGPFKAMGFKAVPPKGEQIFLQAFASTSVEYGRLLDQVRSRSLSLPDVNLDTGAPAHPGDYQLADKTYVALLQKLSKNDFQAVSPALRRNILAYFDDFEAATLSGKTREQLQHLRGAASAQTR
jgi:hypothetical protein